MAEIDMSDIDMADMDMADMDMTDMDMAESSETAQEQSTSEPRKYTLLCQFWPYTRCAYTKEVIDDDEEAIADWTDHVRRHHHDDGHPRDLDMYLFCWLQPDRCPRARRGGSFYDRGEGDEEEDDYGRFGRMMEHMQEHFRDDKPALTRKDLRRDDIVTMRKAFDTKEASEAYLRPHPTKQTERLPVDDLLYFRARLRLSGLDVYGTTNGIGLDEMGDEDEEVAEARLAEFNSRYGTNLEKKDLTLPDQWPFEGEEEEGVDHR